MVVVFGPLVFPRPRLLALDPLPRQHVFHLPHLLLQGLDPSLGFEGTLLSLHFLT